MIRLRKQGSPKSGNREWLWKQVENGELSAAEAIEQLKRDGNNSGSVQAVIAEIESLVGLRKVKRLIYELRAFVEIQQKRIQYGLHTDSLVLHMVFKGNPGVGKTTVARQLGKLFFHLGVLPKGHLVEVERADLVGEYIGHTAQKTREQIRQALGGVLFVDEAYSLARGGEKDFGKEAIDTLVKAMEDHRHEFILILAGYRREMEHFLIVNPGLESRFPIQIDFPDYSINELLSIADLMVRRREYELDRRAKELLAKILTERARYESFNFSNARLVRNIIEKAIRRQALRLVGQKNLSRSELIRIVASDLIADRSDGDV